MKKVWKGFAAAVSAAAIAATGFIGATSAYADDPAPAPAPTTGSITINNALTGDAFNAYRLLSLTNSGSAISYDLIGGVDSAETTALVSAINTTNNNTALVAPATTASDNVKNEFKDNVIAAVDAFKGDDSATMRKFAANLIAAIKTNNVAVTGTATANADGALVINSLAPGYYLVDQTAQTADENGDNVNTLSAYLVDTVIAGQTTSINLKKGTVTLEKKVQDWNDTEGKPTNPTWSDSADHDLGDDVPFQLTGTLPTNYDRYDTFKYIFHDSLSAGLTFNNDVRVYAVNGQGDAATEQEITKSFTVTAPAAPESFTVTNANLKNITEDDKGAAVTINNATKIVVRYTARVNENAMMGSAGNPNTAYLEFSNNPNNGGEGTNKTPEDKVIVFTYKFVVDKTFEGADAPAENDMPEFTLYKYLPTGTDGALVATQIGQPVKVTGNATDGFKAEFPRLDDGKYMVSETKVPQGFSKAPDTYFEISATHTDGDAPALSTLTVTFYTDDTFTTTKDAANGVINTGTVTAEITNNAGSELPSTGGMGTTILYAAGAAIVLIAGIGLAVTLRRRQA
ncbi:isopeptide-forming domain-containing fimbrial protein [Bifidobacterium pseudolongum]|uniref:isopeptide-forming domain-containing fimbrial protein n=1 Tax=Bifidobacterium pseudolongum TaxID=1694 RepID=UPI0010F02D46|nr:isopeptide-forming domain-containing fimbrial protein [Bifidobacterium pseudolongum]RYQ53955.1 Gram-positive pilin backbone subunit 2, Cna-B-like domain-containing protein [Bifidobacterium pseudolongum subsp. pseudolongum]